MALLSDYLNLSDAQARHQWGSILRRRPRPRQVRFAPVETLLCYGLFLADDPVVDPHRYGGATVHTAPQLVHDLARLFVRPASSIMSKMMNLDGSRVNGAKPEVQLFVALSANKDQYYRLYLVALRAARQMGVNDQQLPDFLQYEQWSQLDLEELDDLRSLKHVDEARYQEIIEEDAVKLRAQKLRLGQVLSAAETTQIVQHRARIGQRAFRVDVLRNFDYTCGFCGMAPRSLSGNPLLVASHIKPWADSTNRERRDPHNGIAACPIHDAAFDKGLITVNGGLRVHRSRKLRQSILIDVGVEHNFGDSLADTLLVPPGTASPRGSYLSWHQQHVYQDTLP